MAAGRCCESAVPRTAQMIAQMTAQMTARAPARRREPSQREAFVQLEKVTLTYGRGDHRLHALDETDLTIDKGDFVALVGPSGCGKSTILKLVTGLLRAT